MKMTIISPGPLSTIQDKGRFGYMEYGFSPSGAMDSYSMEIANLLVGNDKAEGVIEMTVMGISCVFDCDAVIAITGADMNPTINGEDCDMYRSIQVHAGDTLSMKTAKSGLRSYLAVSQGFDIPKVMGSLSTNLKCKVGGFEGRKLQKGDEILLRQSTNVAMFGRRKIKPENKFKNEILLRVVLGPQDDYFTEQGIETFLTQTYSVTDKSDRMGVRLDGKKIESKDGVDIISDGIATGSVQIPSSGTPIIMMADRQTTGGYAKIATVISADLKLLAQAAPGTKVNFEKISRETAEKISKKAIKQMRELEYSLMFSL